MRLPKYAETILNKLTACGFKAYAVGGCVRNSLLSLPVFDYDITTSATPEQVKTVLSEFKIIETGIAHGTVTVMVNGHHLEVTTFRGEGKYTDCRHPDSITFGASLEADLSRRDFTMNAIAYNKTDGYIDLFGGRDDISRRLIRCVGNADARLCEDALRILRALRFSACLGFETEEKTKTAVFKNYKLLSHVSKERIFTELKRLICGKNAPSVLIEFYEVFDFILSLSENRDFYLKAARTISNLNDGTYQDYIAALFLNLEKEKIKTVLSLLKSDAKTVKYVCTIASVPSLSGLNKTDVKKLLSKFNKNELTFAAKLQRAAGKISKADVNSFSDFLNQIHKNGECCRLSQLAVSGADLAALGFKGKQIGTTLEAILNEVICERIPNKKSTLINFAEKHLN